MSSPPIPAQALPLAARAPGKCILFGEHAIVHGRPALLLAIDLFTQVALRESDALRLNGRVDEAAAHPYLREAIARLRPPTAAPLEVTVTSRLPKAAGLGSSAAFSSALAAGLLASAGGAARERLALEAFAIERGAQGVGSPGDTTASVAGGYVAVNGGDGPPLWELADDTRRWAVRRVRDPGWVWLLAYSKVPRDTAATVRAVGARLARPDGEELLARFGDVATRGIAAVADEDRAGVARLLGENHALLREVGVSHPRLEALIEAVAPVVQGAKLTGAGAGGSIVALPHPGREIDAARRVARAGGVAYVVRASRAGAALIGSATGDPAGSD